MRRIAVRADCLCWDFKRLRVMLNRRQRFAVFGLIFSQQEFVVFRYEFFLVSGFSVKGGFGSTENFL